MPNPRPRFPKPVFRRPQGYNPTSAVLPVTADPAQSCTVTEPARIVPGSTRSPYLMVPTTSSITIRWRTATAMPTVVSYGLSPTNLTMTLTQDVGAPVLEHSAVIRNLTAGTMYYYAAGSSAATSTSTSARALCHWFSADPRTLEKEPGKLSCLNIGLFHVVNTDSLSSCPFLDSYFKTAPVVGSYGSTRFWVVGDFGALPTECTFPPNTCYAPPRVLRRAASNSTACSLVCRQHHRRRAVRFWARVRFWSAAECLQLLARLRNIHWHQG